MSHIRIDNLSEDLDPRAMADVRGGIWDYSNRLGPLGEHLEERGKLQTGDNGPSIEDGANAGDDSSYYPGLTKLR